MTIMTRSNFSWKCTRKLSQKFSVPNNDSVPVFTATCYIRTPQPCHCKNQNMPYIQPATNGKKLTRV